MSLWHWALVVGVVALVFGAGRIPHIMRDLGKGLRIARHELLEDHTEDPQNKS